MKKNLYFPIPSMISIWWNFGSILGLMLIIQIITGIFLCMHYTPSVLLAFDSVTHVMVDVNYGWIIRYIHANGASFFFICLYLHMARGLYYKSFHFVKVWSAGMLLYLLFMMTAFLGYVLPWGQMSFWGATVITNLVSAIPWLGPTLVEWLWGGFSVGGPTLSRFFTMHYLIPLVSLVLVMVHLFFLHSNGSSNPLGLSLNSDKVGFHPFFTVKDVMGYVFILSCVTYTCLNFPMIFMDPDNFIEANPMITPVHIQPEWYFLFAYAILRSIPSKLGGVVALVMSIVSVWCLVFSAKKPLSSGSAHVSWVHQMSLSFFYMTFACLTWAGSLPVESPFVETSKILTIMYFFLVLMLMCF